MGRTLWLTITAKVPNHPHPRPHPFSREADEPL